MSKINIDPIKAQFASVNSINQRFQQVVDEFQNKVLYRDNPDGEPNRMHNDIDMLGNDIINIGELYKNGEPVIIPDLIWGNILGTLADQKDLSTVLTDQDVRITENAEGIAAVDPEFISQEIARLDAKDAEQDVTIQGIYLDLETTKGRVSANEVNIQSLLGFNVLNTALIASLDDRMIIEEGISADHETRITTNEADIAALEGGRLTDIDTTVDNNTNVSLVVDKTNPLVPTIGLTPEVGTKEPFALVKLDAQGLIPNDQLPFGGAYNSRGVYTAAVLIGDASNPTIDFPTETFANGDFFSVSISSGTVGYVLTKVGGVDTAVEVEAGDALLYSVGGVSVDGWYAVLAQGSGDTVSAPDVAYDPTGNLIIDDVAAINVDLALTDLDTEAGRVKTQSDGHVVNTSNPHAVTAAQVGAAPVAHSNDVTTNPHAVTAGQVGADTSAEVDGKVGTKVDIAGDTMTGPLVLAMSNPKIRITSTDNTAAFILFNDDTSTIRSAMRAEPTTGNIGWESRDSAGVIIASATLINTGAFETDTATSLTVTDGASAETLTRKDYVDTARTTANDAQDLITADKVNSTIAEAGSARINNMVSITQANYDLLTPAADTLYIIVG